MSIKIINADVIDGLRSLPEKSVHCVVTSPPYWGLRDYGIEGQIGLESSPEEYLEKMVQVFREVWRVLRDDGTVAKVARDLNRDSVLIEINPAYVEIARRKLRADEQLFADAVKVEVLV